MNIALCTDDNYANHCAVCITSILENNKDEDIRVYVLTGGLTNENQSKFSYLSGFYKKPVDVVTLDMSAFNQLQVTNHLGRAMYFRFKLPEIVKASKVLYLDCDIIVRHSLKPLFDIDISPFACGVVEDQCGDDVRLHNPIRMFSRYFNSGVLLMNLDYWRQHDVARLLTDWIAHFNGQLACPDQDAMNAVLEEKVLFLDYKYNFQQGFYSELTWLRADKWDAVAEAKTDPIIVHFTAGEKPWHKDCKHPLSSEFDHYTSRHNILRFRKSRCHSASFYLIEKSVGCMRKLYQHFRDKNGLFTQRA